MADGYESNVTPTTSGNVGGLMSPKSVKVKQTKAKPLNHQVPPKK